MCKKFTAAYLDRIGSRPVGWCLHNCKDFCFMSEKQVKTKMQQGVLVNGLKLDEEGNVVIDTAFTKNLMAKSGLAFQPILEADEDEVSVMNKYFALVKVLKTETETTYHFITNKCGYEVIHENKLKSLLEMMDFGGVGLASDGLLVIHKGVDVVDARESQNKPQGMETTAAVMEKPVKDKNPVTQTKKVDPVKSKSETKVNPEELKSKTEVQKDKGAK